MNMNHASFMDGGDDESYFASGTDIDTMSGGYSSAGESLVSQGDLDYLSDDQSEQVGGYNSDELDVDIIQVGGIGSSGNESGSGDDKEQGSDEESEEENNVNGNEEEDGTPSAEVAVATVASSLQSESTNPNEIEHSHSGLSGDSNRIVNGASNNQSAFGNPDARKITHDDNQHNNKHPKPSNVNELNNATAAEFNIEKSEGVKKFLDEMKPNNYSNLNDIIDDVLVKLDIKNKQQKQDIKDFLQKKNDEKFDNPQEKLRTILKFGIFASQYVKYANEKDNGKKNEIVEKKIKASLVLDDNNNINELSIQYEPN